MNPHIVPAAILLYVVIVAVASFRFNMSLTPDRVAILIALVALTTGRVRLFLKDWSIFIVVLLAWQVLSSMSRNLGHFKPHVTEMIVVDKFLFFGHVPTLWLQAHFYHPGHVAWYDVGATALYLLHFAFPMGVAFVLWMWRRPVFLEFMVSFLILALAGFATFVLYPTAPPWIAANWWHYMPHVHKILKVGLAAFGEHQSYSEFYKWIWKHVGWDLFGAVPSEHAALPFLCFLYVRKAFGRVGWLLLGYSVVVWVAVIYLGEHYATDVIVGVLYAGAAYAAVQYLMMRRSMMPWSSTGRSTKDGTEVDPEDDPERTVTDSVPA